MSVDITLQAAQDEIAESLVAPIEPRGGSQGAAQGNGEALADLSADRTDWRSELAPQEELDRLAASVARPGESWQREAEQRQAQQQPQEQAQQYTPEQIREGMQALDTLIQQHQLNDPVSAKDFASDFCQAFGTDAFQSGVNVEALGNVMAKTAISAAQIFEHLQTNPGQLNQQLVPPESARAFTYDFLRAWGVDPRTVPVNESLLAETVLRGALNFYDAYQRSGGKVTSLDQLNDPAAAEYFLSQFLAAFGIQDSVDRATALKVADAGGKYLLSFLPKLGQIQPANQTARRAGGQRAGKRFRTNNDIFAPEILERLDLEKAHGRNTGEFAPKGRRGSSRFRTNQDIFSDDVMSAYDRL